MSLTLANSPLSNKRCESLVCWKLVSLHTTAEGDSGGSCGSQSVVSVRDVTGVVTPPDKSLHGVSYHRQIDVSACQLDPCCRRFLPGSSAPIASSQAPRLENVLPGRARTHTFTHILHPSIPFPVILRHLLPPFDL